jgi:hypothetical protein
MKSFFVLAAPFCVPCEQVQAEMEARPHNNGTYSLIDSDKDVLDFQRVTGNKKYLFHPRLFHQLLQPPHAVLQ